MLPLLSWIPRVRAGWAALAAGGATLAPAGRAMAAPPTHVLRLPINYLAPANASGEAVRFLGTVTFTSQLVPDPDTGEHALLATFDTNGLVGTGTPSLSRYVLTARESMQLPHGASQTVSLTFPMEPASGSKLKKLRTGVANITFSVDVATGAITSLTAGAISLM